MSFLLKVDHLEDKEDTQLSCDSRNSLEEEEGVLWVIWVKVMVEDNRSKKIVI